MTEYTFTIYAPPETGFPWLAVTLQGGRPVHVLACASEPAAHRALASMKARWSVRNAHAHIQRRFPVRGAASLN